MPFLFIIIIKKTNGLRPPHTYATRTIYIKKYYDYLVLTSFKWVSKLIQIVHIDGRLTNAESTTTNGTVVVYIGTKNVALIAWQISCNNTTPCRTIYYIG